jgi:hypothetical protein
MIAVAPSCPGFEPPLFRESPLRRPRRTALVCWLTNPHDAPHPPGPTTHLHQRTACGDKSHYAWDWWTWPPAVEPAPCGKPVVFTHPSGLRRVGAPRMETSTVGGLMMLAQNHSTRGWCSPNANPQQTTGANPVEHGIDRQPGPLRPARRKDPVDRVPVPSPVQDPSGKRTHPANGCGEPDHHPRGGNGPRRTKARRSDPPPRWQEGDNRQHRPNEHTPTRGT